ncbi:MAG: uroporphyrinogen decarboxylase [Planctomycetes bacterium]|nr:uroporphyrinogen decarboxylase [Planctomycetota bacterium]
MSSDPRPRLRSAGNRQGLPPALWGSRFLRACRGEPVEATPVWLMRQAGRYLPSYRALRTRHSFLALCRNPQACAEAALTARAFLEVDASIVFSDILLVLEALGVPLSFAGDGPQLRPLADAAAIAGLRDPLQAAADLGFVAEAVRATVAGSPPDIPCIGFAGAPFTLAAYALEGGASRGFLRTKRFLYAEPVAWQQLCERLSACVSALICAQVAAGAACVQFFDSWAGTLSRADYAEYALPYLQRCVQAVPPGIAVIVFATGSTHLLELLAESGADVVGVDSGPDLLSAWQRLPPGLAVQGNLDPAWLLAPWNLLRARTRELLDRVRGRAGHIANLGHGVLKDTDPWQARAWVRYVHEATRR